MIDIALVRKDPEHIKKIAEQKKTSVDIDRLLELDTQRKELQNTVDLLNAERNKIADANKGKKPEVAQIEEGKRLRAELDTHEKTLNELVIEYIALLESIPNIPSEDTPVGPDDSGNQELRKHGEPRQFSFTPKSHWELGKALDVIDSERAAKVSGSRFTYLKGHLVQLEFALINLVMSLLTDEKVLSEIIDKNNLTVSPKPFIPVLPPLLIKPDPFHKMARLEPKDERYHIPSDDLYLIGSAEHALGAMHMNETFKEEELPRRYLGFSPAFRREAGSYGKDMQGILRLHQFDKLEMESFSTAEDGLAEQNFFVAIQEHIMQLLELPYRVVAVCTGDMGGPDARQLDIETWLPSENRYRETHSADFVTDYQSRRLKTKVKRKSGKPELVHMNDATALALGRTMIAVMENYQQEDGSITVPTVLKNYLQFAALK